MCLCFPPCPWWVQRCREKNHLLQNKKTNVALNDQPSFVNRMAEYHVNDRIRKAKMWKSSFIAINANGWHYYHYTPISSNIHININPLWRRKEVIRTNRYYVRSFSNTKKNGWNVLASIRMMIQVCSHAYAIEKNGRSKIVAVWLEIGLCVRSRGTDTHSASHF